MQPMDVHSGLPADPRLERCGFCKLYGPELEFYSKRYDIQIGRRSKSTKLDVVLGRGTAACDRAWQQRLC